MVYISFKCESLRKIHHDGISACRKLILSLFGKGKLQGISDIGIDLPGLILSVGRSVDRKVRVGDKTIALYLLGVKHGDDDLVPAVQRDRQSFLCFERRERGEEPFSCVKLPITPRLFLRIFKYDIENVIFNSGNGRRIIDICHPHQSRIGKLYIFHPAHKCSIIIRNMEFLYHVG